MNGELFSLAGRIACVSGASSGVGRSIANAMAQAGAAVVGVARREALLQEWVRDVELAGGRAAACAADLGDSAGIAAVAERVSATFGAPDILVNAAGINPRQTADELTLEAWQLTLDLNLSAPFLLARALVPAMQAKEWGRIINIASLQSVRAFPNGMAYGAFAERLAIAAGNLIPVPEGMAPAHAALTEPCATAWHALALAARASWRPVPECRALVIGGGSVGLLGGLILKAWGAREVRLAETNPLRRGTAAAVGLDAFEPIAAPAGKAGFDIVLDAVGATATRAAALGAVRPGGVISHVGLLDWAGEFDARTLTLSEITLLGVYTYTDADLRASLAALHDGRLGALYWIEERPLAEGGQAFHDLNAGRSPAAKIVLKP